jgi:hypothetical protein
MSTVKKLYCSDVLVSSDITFVGVVETLKTHINSTSKHSILDDDSISLTSLWSSTKIDNLINSTEKLSNKSAANGYAGLDANALIPNALIPPLAITKPIVYNDIAARDADVANIEMGDVAIILDIEKTYIYNGSSYTELLSSGCCVSSVNGKSGSVISLDTSDIPEVTNLYYTEDRVSANADVVNNSSALSALTTWYETESQESCFEILPDVAASEIASATKGTSVTPISGTYRCTFSSQFELTNGGNLNSRCPAAIEKIITQINALSTVAHAAAYGAGEIIYPGNYYIAAATTHNGVLEFDALGDPNALFVLTGGAAHSIAVGASFVLSNGAKTANILWYTVGALSCGADVTIRGTFIGDAAIGIGSGCILDGRLFTTNGAITTGNVMELPVDDTFGFDFGVASQFVMFSIIGDITNPLPGSNPAIINSGQVGCGTGTVTGFSPYDGTYSVPLDETPYFRVGFGIYSGEILAPSSLMYVENTLVGKYYSVACACNIVSTGDIISVRAFIDTEKGGIIVTNRTLYVDKIA